MGTGLELGEAVWSCLVDRESWGEREREKPAGLCDEGYDAIVVADAEGEGIRWFIVVEYCFCTAVFIIVLDYNELLLGK